MSCEFYLIKNFFAFIKKKSADVLPLDEIYLYWSVDLCSPCVWTAKPLLHVGENTQNDKPWPLSSARCQSVGTEKDEEEGGMSGWTRLRMGRDHCGFVDQRRLLRRDGNLKGKWASCNGEEGESNPAGRNAGLGEGGWGQKQGQAEIARVECLYNGISRSKVGIGWSKLENFWKLLKFTRQWIAKDYHWWWSRKWNKNEEDDKEAVAVISLNLTQSAIYLINIYWAPIMSHMIFYVGIGQYLR